MEEWKTRQGVTINGRQDGVTENGRMAINISNCFLRGDNYSPVGCCLREIPVSLLIKKTDGYRIG